MTFKEFVEWCNDRACDGCWGMIESMVCMDIISSIVNCLKEIIKECIEEIKKCVLICSNCHKELHANLWSLDKLKGKEEVESYETDN